MRYLTSIQQARVPGSAGSPVHTGIRPAARFLTVPLGAGARATSKEQPS